MTVKNSVWADQPYELIQTDSFSRDKSHAAYYVATDMAMAHNGMLRGLNSIYLQAIHIPKDDHRTIKDFLTYCQCWCEWLHHHHDVEEEEFFPSIDRLSGVADLMDHNVEQHLAFTTGFMAFDEYVRTCQPKDFDGQKLRDLIDGFAEPLTRHLHDEVDTLRALDKYDSNEVMQAHLRLEKLVMAAGNFRVAPLVFGTADRSFDGGVHDFPPVPAIVPWLINYIFAWPHRGAWRFNPCTMWRDRRELAFTSLKTDA